MAPKKDPGGALAKRGGIKPKKDLKKNEMKKISGEKVKMTENTKIDDEVKIANTLIPVTIKQQR